MRSARLTLWLACRLVGAAAGTAGCASQRTASVRTAVPRVAANSSTTRREPPSTAASSVVRAFASSYGRHLDGRLPGYGPGGRDAEPLKRRLARRFPPAFGRERCRRLRSPIASGGDSFTVGYRDRAHSYSAQLTIARHRARWQITQVVAPDLDSILRRSRAIALTPGSRPAATAARRFLRGYLPWLYGHARITAIHAASAQLIGQLRTHPPRVPITLQHVTPVLVALGTQSTRGAWLVLANITAGQQTYQLTVTVARSRGQWRATNVSARLLGAAPLTGPNHDAVPQWPTLTVTLRADGTGELHLSPSTTEQIEADGLEQARRLVLSKVAAYAETNHHRAVRLRVQEPDGEWLLGVNPDGTGFELTDDTQPADERHPQASDDLTPSQSPTAGAPNPPLRRLTVTDADADAEPLAPVVRVTSPGLVGLPIAARSRRRSAARTPSRHRDATSTARLCTRVRRDR